MNLHSHFLKMFISQPNLNLEILELFLYVSLSCSTSQSIAKISWSFSMNISPNSILNHFYCYSCSSDMYYFLLNTLQTMFFSITRVMYLTGLFISVRSMSYSSSVSLAQCLGCRITTTEKVYNVVSIYYSLDTILDALEISWNKIGKDTTFLKLTF